MTNELCILLAAFSGTLGALQLESNQQATLWNIYVPWARRVARRIKFGGLMMVHYEKEFDTTLIELRSRLGVEPVPHDMSKQ